MTSHTFFTIANIRRNANTMHAGLRTVRHTLAACLRVELIALVTLALVTPDADTVPARLGTERFTPTERLIVHEPFPTHTNTRTGALPMSTTLRTVRYANMWRTVVTWAIVGMAHTNVRRHAVSIYARLGAAWQAEGVVVLRGAVSFAAATPTRRYTLTALAGL